MIDKDAIKEAYKDGKINSLDDINKVMQSMVKDVVEVLTQQEMTNFLGYEKHHPSIEPSDNYRNGYNDKSLNSKFGPIDISIPRDRNSNFNPELIKKRQTDLTGIEDTVISLYAKGLSTRDISSHLEDLYDHTLSPESISSITDAVIEKAREWQVRPLEQIYAIVFMDATFLKVRIEGQVRNVAAYLMIGITLDGTKEVLGIWIAKTETSKYWLGVLNELKNRGVQDVLIFAIDGLNGFSNAISAVYPYAEVQRCIVHQIRNSLKHVSWKDRKEVANDLKDIYRAVNEESAQLALTEFSDKWGNTYPHISMSWTNNWNELSTFFKYPEAVRRLIYTTNPIESLNASIKKVIRNKGSFPTETSAFKLVFLAISEAQKKWTMRLRDWPEIYSQLNIFFKETIQKYEN